MTLKNYTLTFSGSAQSLSTLLAATVEDVEVYAIDIQADTGNANVCYVGAADVAAGTGIRIPVPVTTVPEPPYRIGDFGTPKIRMANVYMLGTASQKAHILVFGL
jgi:hypothetical protein